MLVAISRYLAEEVHLGRRDALIVPQSSEASFTVALEVAIHVTAVTPVAVAYHVSLQSRKTRRVTNQ